jgi:hypothetical protein
MLSQSAFEEYQLLILADLPRAGSGLYIKTQYSCGFIGAGGMPGPNSLEFANHNLSGSSTALHTGTEFRETLPEVARRAPFSQSVREV